MEGWKSKPLGEVAQLKKGKITAQSDSPQNNWLPVINADAILNDPKIWGNPQGSITCSISDILMLWDGERSGLVTTNKEGIVGSTFCKITCSNEIDSHFCFLYLQLNYEWIQNRRTGTGVPHAPKDLKEILNVSFPESLTEQRQISEILTTLDDAIQQTEQVIAKQKNIKAGLMRDLLTYGIDENGTIRSPKTHCFVVKNGLMVPEEWEVEPLNEIANITGGKRLPKGSSYSTTLTGYKYLRVTDFYQKQINYNQLENISKEIYDILARYEIFKNDLFISIAGSIGYVGILKPTDEDVYILTENALRIAVIKDNVNNDFLCLTLNSGSIQNQIWSEIGTGGGVPKLAMHRVKSLNIPIPNSSNEQQQIVSILDAQDELITTEENKLSKLLKTKQGLMHDLLTGKVRVIL